VIRIAEGTLRWGYHIAATLQTCTVSTTDGVRTLTGTVVSADAFRLAQQPLTFVVTHPTKAWSWPIHSLQVAGSALTARCGPRET
jgi:hypothetical protein